MTELEFKEQWNVYKPLENKNKKLRAYAKHNLEHFYDLYDRLLGIALTMFKWKNLPDTVDERFLELQLITKGFALYFNEPDIGDLGLSCTIGGNLNIYGIPTLRKPYSVDNTIRFSNRTDKDSILIYNNYLHKPTVSTLQLYAERITDIDRAIEVNVKANKTPVMISVDEKQVLTLKNAFMEADGNAPVIFADKSIDTDRIKSWKTDAPYIADRLYTLRQQLWNECLDYLGITSVNTDKREHLLADEITLDNGDVSAQRYAMLAARKQACKSINKMFGTNIDVDFRDSNDMINHLLKKDLVDNEEDIVDDVREDEDIG